METVKIALLGLGTVGTGVYKVLKAQQEEIPHKVGAKIQLKKSPCPEHGEGFEKTG